jgi:hypothetical protein
MRSEPDWSAPIEPKVSSRAEGLAGWIGRSTVRGTLLVVSVGWSWSVSSANLELPAERLRPGPGSYANNSSIEEAEQFIVRDLESWRATWGRVHGRSRPTLPLPAIDFEHEMVAVAAIGRQRSGGFVVRIERAYREGPTLVIVVREEHPGRGCVVPSALTYPVDLAKLPLDAAPVSFRTEVVTRDCE